VKTGVEKVCDMILENHSILPAATVMTTITITLPPQKNFSIEATKPRLTSGETMIFPMERSITLTGTLPIQRLLRWLIPYQQQ
jgi:hypothetical protein